MTLFGALTSGVSGLTAQSSAIGAISDNITNVNTIGYKGTQVDFQTLVTVQTSSTFYSAGGVQSRPRQDTGVQGLLQSSTSQTDIAISGSGFFVVNEASQPTLSNEFLFTRAGSFYQDDEGYLRNTSGYYLQAWPTTADGTVTTNNTSLTIPNQNVISTDFLATVNLNRVGGTATATSEIGIGANLPSTASQGDTHKTDVQFFDTLGNANTTSFLYTRGNRDNEWDVEVTPPSGVNVVTLFSDTAGATVYESRGQLEFTGVPADGATVVIDGVTYEFDSNASVVETATLKPVTISTSATVAQAVAALVSAVKADDSDFSDHGGFTNNRIQVNPGQSTALYFTEDGTGDITVDPTGLLTSDGSRATLQESSYTVEKTATANRDYHQLTFAVGSTLADDSTIQINGILYEIDGDASGATVASAIAVTATTGAALTAAQLNTFLTNLESAIETNDAAFASGAASVRVRNVSDTTAGGPSGNADTLVLSTLSSGSFGVLFDDGSTSVAFTGTPTEPDGTATYVNGTAHQVDKNQAITFDSDGLPSGFAVSEMEIIGFANGAANMDDDASNSTRLTLDFGRVGEANGFTQFGAEFTPGFITQNGSQFGTLAGVTIDEDGLMTALFDNGETRPIYKIPIATFVNVNGLNARTGNVWNQTQASGDNTLREANNGVAGSVTQAALESSTVDIGEEFTKMIVVQRAYSASTRIISTADEMLEELVRIKR
ncbi:MAG: flagellar hook-basal body complex protein [Rhodospirillales bacterium]|nr:flagellar hook-basal body complex protein [Rhodospirillales bacterium]